MSMMAIRRRRNPGVPKSNSQVDDMITLPLVTPSQVPLMGGLRIGRPEVGKPTKYMVPRRKQSARP